MAEQLDEREKMFELFKAGWMAAAKAVESERDDRARGWNSGSDSPILLGIREGLQAAVNTIRDGHQPSWLPNGRHDVQQAFDGWLQKQVKQ